MPIDDAQTRKKSISQSMAKTSGAIKNIAIFLPILTAIAIAFWKSEVRSWLTSEIKTELEEEQHTRWFFYRLSTVLASLDTDEAAALRDRTELRTIVRDILRDELTGGQLEGLAALEANHSSVIQAILNPPAYASLEAIVTQRVDAIYTFELYDRRKLQVILPDGSAELDSSPLQNVLISDLTARFYAADDQRISISIQPNFGQDWREAISSGHEAMLLKIGGQDVEIGLGPRELDITCDVRNGLGLRNNGMIQVRAEPKSQKFDKTDGFQLDVTIVARKGDRPC